MSSSGKLESVLAKRLAGNDKKIRDKAMRKLRQWLTAKSKNGKGMGDVNMLRIWKGLFYCMWMADKPLVQEEVAKSIAELVHCFGTPKSSTDFIDAAFQTLSREWNGIDRLRLDKFMMLVRQVLRNSFLFLRNNQWSSDLIQQFCSACQKNVVCSDSNKYVPKGLLYHFADIFCEEMAKVGDELLDHKTIMQLLEPYFKILLQCNEHLTCRIIIEKVFHHFLRQIGMAEENELEAVDDTYGGDSEASGEEDMGNESDDEMTRLSDDEDNLPLIDRGEPLDPRAGRVDVTLPELPVDLQKLADEIFKRARKPTVKGKNRRLGYKLVKMYRRALMKLEGDLPIHQLKPEKKPMNKKAIKLLENKALHNLQSLNHRIEEELQDEEVMSEDQDLQPEKTKRKKKNLKNRKEQPVRREKVKFRDGKKMQKNRSKPGKNTGFKAKNKA